MFTSQPALKALLIGGVTLALLVGCTTVQSTSSEEAPEQLAENETSEASTERSEPALATFEDLELSLNSSPEELALFVVEEVLSKWINAGASDAIFDAKFEANQSWDEFLPGYAVAASSDYIDTYVVESRQDAETAKMIETFSTINLDTLDAYRFTARNTENPENQEGYELNWVVSGETRILEEEPGSLTLEVEVLMVSNSELNEIPPLEYPEIVVVFELLEESERVKLSMAKFFIVY